MNADEKREYRSCKVRYSIKRGWHALNRALQRGFPVTGLREMVFRAKWFPGIGREYVKYAVFEDKNSGGYWTLVLRFKPCCIHADTVWPSKYREIQDFKSEKRKLKQGH